MKNFLLIASMLLLIACSEPSVAKKENTVQQSLDTISTVEKENNDMLKILIGRK